MARKKKRPGSPRDEFEALFQRHWQEVRRAALPHCYYNEAAAADMAEEAFLKLWKQMEAGKVIANPRSWLLRVVCNTAISFLRRASWRKHCHDRKAQEALENSPSSELEPLEVLLEREDKTEQERRRRELPWALQTLPEVERSLLQKRYNQNLSYRKIADARGQSKSTIERKTHQALDRLRRVLEAPCLG